jgi:hypothetical protein
VWDDAQGRLVISRVGKKRAASALVEGQNIEIGTARRSGNERFQTVMVIGHAPAADSGAGPFITLRETATDNGVPRKRLLMIVQDPQGAPRSPTGADAWACPSVSHPPPRH